jgi:hypothetical protein
MKEIKKDKDMIVRQIELHIAVLYNNTAKSSFTSKEYELNHVPGIGFSIYKENLPVMKCIPYNQVKSFEIEA